MAICYLQAFNKAFRDELAKAQKRISENSHRAKHEADFREASKAIWQRDAYIVSVEDQTGWGAS